MRKKKKFEKQVQLIFVFMAILIAAIFLSYWFSREIKQFNYAGLEFEKVKIGSLVLYQTKFPLRDVTGDIAKYMPFYFREDPRKLKGMQVEGNIRLKTNVAIAANADIVEKCPDSILSGTSLALYLNNLGITSFGATTNKTEAEEYKRNYVNCNNTEKYSILIFQNGNESKIKKEGDCYMLYVKNCEIMNVTERFMIGVYAHSMGREI